MADITLTPCGRCHYHTTYITRDAVWGVYWYTCGRMWWGGCSWTSQAYRIGR